MPCLGAVDVNFVSKDTDGAPSKQLRMRACKVASLKMGCATVMLRDGSRGVTHEGFLVCNRSWMPKPNDGLNSVPNDSCKPLPTVCIFRSHMRQHYRKQTG